MSTSNLAYKKYLSEQRRHPSVHVQFGFSSTTVHPQFIKMKKLNLNIPDFEQFTDDQQFVNIVHALDRLETRRGGPPVEELWEMAREVLQQLKKVPRPEVTARRLLTLISAQLQEKMPTRTPKEVTHTVHSVLFCADYILCANTESPDPNQPLIDSISRELCSMKDLGELFCAVEEEETNEENRGHKVKARNVMREETKVVMGKCHDMQEGDQLILSRLQEWADKTLWNEGTTAEQVTTGLRSVLGVGETGLDDADARLSEKLWELLHKRRNCDAEKSLQLTWLNIVGYALRCKRIEGSAQQLCRSYFPAAEADAYKAIDKGRSGETACFNMIEPLFKKYLF